MLIIIPFPTTAIVVRVITVVTREAGRAVQRLRVAILTRGASVVYATATFVGNTRMWTVVAREPVIGCVAASTIQAKHPGMEDRVSMTACAFRR